MRIHLKKVQQVIHNYHEPIRGMLSFLLFVFVALILMGQVLQAQESREAQLQAVEARLEADEHRDRAVSEIIEATNNQTIILCTLIIRSDIAEEEQDTIREICEEEIQRFDRDDFDVEDFNNGTNGQPEQQSRLTPQSRDSARNTDDEPEDDDEVITPQEPIVIPGDPNEPDNEDAGVFMTIINNIRGAIGI